jgi:hypothetical protein
MSLARVAGPNTNAESAVVSKKSNGASAFPAESVVIRQKPNNAIRTAVSSAADRSPRTPLVQPQKAAPVKERKMGSEINVAPHASRPAIIVLHA